jgi:hemoglobin-like flavoprotein
MQYQITPEHVRLVQHTFAQVNADKEAAEGLFYSCLLDLDPRLERFFHDASKPRRRIVMNLLGSVVRRLDQVGALAPALERLGKTFKAYDLDEYDYKSGRDALLWTFERRLGADFTPDVKAAWTEVSELLANTMKSGARH